MDAMFILFQVPLINKNGTKSMHCIIRGKFVISPCRKSALFWIHAVILLFHAEILPCGPPLLPHSWTEPFLGVNAEIFIFRRYIHLCQADVEKLLSAKLTAK